MKSYRSQLPVFLASVLLVAGSIFAQEGPPAAPSGLTIVENTGPSEEPMATRPFAESEAVDRPETTVLPAAPAPELVAPKGGYIPTDEELAEVTLPLLQVRDDRSGVMRRELRESLERHFARMEEMQFDLVGGGVLLSRDLGKAKVSLEAAPREDGTSILNIRW